MPVMTDVCLRIGSHTRARGGGGGGGGVRVSRVKCRVVLRERERHRASHKFYASIRSMRWDYPCKWRRISRCTSPAARLATAKMQDIYTLLGVACH